MSVYVIKMTSLLYLIWLLCSLSCYGHENELQKQGSAFTNSYLKSSNGYRLNDDYDNRTYYEGEYVGNPDFDAEIERPCRVFDLNCIRKYFAEHSKCKIRRGPLPRNLFVSQETVYFSAVNLTSTVVNGRMGGFRSARIEEFYVNRRTNRMVFSINFRGYSYIFPSVYFRFYRNGREPVVVLTELAAFFPSLTFTAIIPNINDLQLREVEITAYVDTAPAFYIEPTSLLESGDPVVAQSLAELFADLSTTIQEVMLTESQFYPPAYIQYNICDFGLKVLPVDNNDNIFTIQG